MSLRAVEAAWRQLFAKGMAEIQRGNFAQALEHMKAALQLQPEHLETLYNVARLHEELQQWDAALAGYDLCLSKQVHWPAAWNNRGNVLRALGNWVKAEQAYRRCLEIDPSVAAFVLPNLGQTCCALGRVQEGVHIYQQALTLQPHPETWNNLGVAYSSEAHYTDALHAFTQAVRLHPGFATAWSNIGAALQKTRQFQKAIDAFEKAVQLTPQVHELWCQYGHCLRDARSFEKAKAAYEKSLQLNPSQSETKLALAHVAFEMVDLKSAKRYVQEVLHDEPENTQAWWTQVILSVAPVTRSWCDARSEREDLLHALDALCQAQS
jgi:tetratricopeptide (TPR) repeat protein